MSQSRKRYADASAEKIFPHKHCSTCSKIVPEFGDGYCSAQCRGYEKQKSSKDKRKWLTWIIVGVTIAFVFVLVLVLGNP
ncbi:MAG: DUF2116 family Zn-ribbon domain-containing protein [Candidatus Lokiarchaeota archaeon]|nr:DUF2116 family Zn-ribbon domain-containing protein [Candidatus Lokiarchaeota archaeon]